MRSLDYNPSRPGIRRGSEKIARSEQLPFRLPLAAGLAAMAVKP